MDKPREYLKKLRADAGLTTQEVADAFGISKQYYSLIETGVSQKRMDITLVRKIADLFGLTLEQVADEEQKLLEDDNASMAEVAGGVTADRADNA